ncbi:MAG: hypothetical protein JSW71_12140 [Gemmatimonadota bacterium]|nr:MAG: hypothetical protein JSW71_12140 [Gemmatimonadota bacterium]
MKQQGMLELIKSRFGSRDVTIERAYSSSESFRALCGDYVECLTALAHWQESDSEHARLREAEYSELITQLTGEIETWLLAMESKAASGTEVEAEA